MFGIGDFIQVGKVVDSILDKFVADKSERDKLKAEINQALIEAEQKTIQKASENVKAEIQGESWLQRNWRPLLMVVIITIIANNFVLVPYLSLFTSKAVVLELPNELFKLMEIGVGGYVVGRSVEKGIRNWKEK